MANNLKKTTALGLIAACAFVGGAQAGGFSRGEADTDILYEDGDIAARAGYVYVMPQRGYDSINGASTSDDDFTQNYSIPSFSAKFRVSDNFSCALTYTEPFGAKSEYGADARAADRNADRAEAILAPVGAGKIPLFIGGNAVLSSQFKTTELGGTCAVSVDAGQGRFSVLGGLFTQSFDYTEVKDYGTLNLRDDGEMGYRFGAAYEIKEYALRAELMYRSKVEHDAEGVFTSAAPLASLPGAFGGPIPLGTQLSSTGNGTLPQSLELSLQSGIAPDWLAFGSVKWTDWSVLQTLNYRITGLGPQTKDFFWQDGWTISGGVGHNFTDKISGAISLTWDRGVGTGADIMTDTWTIGAGTQIKAGPGVVRLGAAATYLTEGSQSTAQGADFNATVGGDWAYAVSASYKISF
ncbi:outer membrane protein transport protein [Rhizobium sp. AG855]|uniref:OmpP1/FadL family transporter n=1 Tax=Rhizobium sp. AG855 TaxID=2183898 RepID=UPI000E70905B|nr:outer membrane protein transport protein [Rhizobium sp. AG855]RKE84996.1 long-chain fatty acid transport protein [Rhizobium sp. AG855]